MSPSRRAGVVGVFAGGVLALAGVATLTLPLFYAGRALSSSLDVTVRHEELSRSVTSWLIGGPIGLAALALGLLVFVLSIVIYFDARRKEAART